MRRFRTYDLNQPYLLPPALQDWLPANHLARFIVEVSEELDLTTICASYDRRDGRGAEAYHPLLLTRLLLYAYCVGKPSSRQIEKATYDEVAFRYLSADQHPDHDTIANFRQQHLTSLAGLFVQALRLCREAGLVKLGHVALDGTKVQAQASRRKTLQGDKLAQREQELSQRVEELLGRAAQVDAEEDARYGKGQRGDELPAELATTQQRLAKLREIKSRMEQEAREQAAKLERERAAAGGKPRNEAEKKRWQRARKQAQFSAQRMNPTDADSKLMKDGASGAIVQAYNAQAVVDEQRQIIVAADVTTECNDKGQLVPMVQRMKRSLHGLPVILTADAGYWSDEALADEALHGLDVLVPPDSQAARKDDQQRAANAPRTARAEAMRARLKNEVDKAVYARRQAVVEPVFGQIKARRGFRRFSLRGLAKVQAEWALICLTHNLLKLHRGRMATKAASKGLHAPHGTAEPTSRRVRRECSARSREETNSRTELAVSPTGRCHHGKFCPTDSEPVPTWRCRTNEL
jgi:transposase